MSFDLLAEVVVFCLIVAQGHLRQRSNSVCLLVYFWLEGQLGFFLQSPLLVLVPGKLRQLIRSWLQLAVFILGADHGTLPKTDRRWTERSSLVEFLIHFRLESAVLFLDCCAFDCNLLLHSLLLLLFFLIHEQLVLLVEVKLSMITQFLFGARL